jgi:hypothetical protein
MPSFSYLRIEADKIGRVSQDPSVAKFAQIVRPPCDECDGLDKNTKAAQDEAKRAKREAKK